MNSTATPLRRHPPTPPRPLVPRAATLSFIAAVQVCRSGPTDVRWSQVCYRSVLCVKKEAQAVGFGLRHTVYIIYEVVRSDADAAWPQAWSLFYVWPAEGSHSSFRDGARASLRWEGETASKQ